jgi:hypothetical protein
MDRALNVLQRLRKLSPDFHDLFTVAEILPAVTNDSLWPIILRNIDELELNYVKEDTGVSHCLTILEPSITSIESALRCSSSECNNFHSEAELRDLILACSSNSSVIYSELQNRDNEVVSSRTKGEKEVRTPLQPEDVMTKYTSVLNALNNAMTNSEAEVKNIKRYLLENYPLDSDFNGALNSDIHACIEQLVENDLILAEVSVLKDVINKTEVTLLSLICFYFYIR